ncbi:MAG: 30S ribosomal protein S20 [Planctomycetota bacterium]|nr:30S ribosomal protein S20 [Planctomycetota bacterium]
MGHSLSADKRERQNEVRRARNLANRRTLKKDMKNFLKVAQENPAEAEKQLAKAQRSLDVAARKNAIPKKRADRKKGRLARMIHRAKTQKAEPKPA